MQNVMSTYTMSFLLPLYSDIIFVIDHYCAYCLSLISAFLGQILFILACNYDIHASLDEFEFWSDPTTDHRVSFP